MSLSYRTIKAQFESHIFQRGVDYFNGAKVGNVILNEDEITGYVDGSNGNKYQVTIYLNDNLTRIFDMQCSCPYEDYCKHAAAVLLFYIKFGPQKRTEKPVTNPYLELADFKEESRVIELDLLQGNPRLRELFAVETAKKKVSSAVNKRTRAVLVFDYDESYHYSQKVKWLIFPGVQAIKKTGGVGRISMLKNKDSLTEPVDEEIRELYEELTDNLGISQKLEKYADYIVKKKLPVHFRKTGIRFEFLAVDSFTFNFKLFSFEPQVFFRSILCANTEKKSIIIELKKGFIKTKSNFVFIDLDSSELLYFPLAGKPEILPELILKFSDDSLFFNAADIRELSSLLERQKVAEHLSVVFKNKKIVINSILPKTVLEIEEKAGFITLRIIFEYKNMVMYHSYKNFEYVVSAAPDADECVICKRDYKNEERIYDYIRHRLKKFVDDDAYYPNYHYHAYDEIKYVNLMLTMREFLFQFGLDFIGEGFEIKYRGEKEKIKKSTGSIKVSVTSGIDWFDVEAGFVDEDGNEQPFTFDAPGLANGLVRIKDRYVLLSKEEIEKIKRLYDAGMADDGTLKINKLHFNTIDLLYEDLAGREKELDKTLEIMDRLKDFKKIEHQTTPAAFKGKLRDYQHDGFNWLCFLFGYSLNGCLADDMGLGKTVQTLCFLQHLKSIKKLNRVLLITPVSTIVNWESEISRFTPELKFLRHFGTGRDREQNDFQDIDIIITSYQTFRNDVELFKDLNFTYVVLDEAQNIKNSLSQTFKAVKLVNAEHKLTLTGTPVENNTLELWSQMDFLNHGILGTINSFKKEFALKIEKYGDKDAAQRLKKLVQPFILRRKKEEVAKDLPDKEEIVYYCEMEDAQRKFYETQRALYLNKVTDEIDRKGVENSAMVFFEGLLRLRQAVLYPDIISKDAGALSSCKNEALFDLVDDIISENHKILVFSQFTETLKRIRKQFDDRACGYSYLDGATKNRDREIKKFQTQEDVKVFLVSLKAGGIGINLTAADYVILFDPWWNPAVENQAIDRAHRIGQKNKVIVYRLIVKDSIEEKILLLQEKKKKLVSDLIAEDSSFFKSLTKKDILSLFG